MSPSLRDEVRGGPRRLGARALISPGAGRFVSAAGRRDGRIKPLTVWYHSPRRLRADTPIVFVMHGVKRDALTYRNTWTTAAKRFGFLLLCPELTSTDYPRKAYGLGNLIDEDRKHLPEEDWTFGVVERLFDEVREATVNASKRYHIYGHSAGGQFVHRLVLFSPQARFDKAIAANTGWYTMPTFEEKFPYGLRRSGRTLGELERSFARRLVVLLGERDTDAEDPLLRRSSAAQRQGRNRLERGQAFYGVARTEAAGLGADFGWTLRTVPGAAHLDRQMMSPAVRMLLADA